jgi:hypothetical protein
LILLGVHLAILINAKYLGAKLPGHIYDIGIVMGVLPIAAVMRGRWAPYLMVFPITLVPISGDTVSTLVYENPVIDVASGWTLYAIIPLELSLLAALWFKSYSTEINGLEFARRALLLNAWMFFLLNWAEFRSPWPWAPWTTRTPNGIIFTVCIFALTGLALALRDRKNPMSNRTT